jgi:hypothetical protein
MGLKMITTADQKDLQFGPLSTGQKRALPLLWTLNFINEGCGQLQEPQSTPMTRSRSQATGGKNLLEGTSLLTFLSGRLKTPCDFHCLF